MPTADFTATFKLLQAATRVDFEVVSTDIQPSLGDEGNSIVRIELRLGALEEGEEADEEDREDAAADQAEWGGFGFIYTIAVLSFADARHRGYAGPEYAENDDFTVADLFDGLRFVRGELHFYADYVRNRCVKTDITVRPDGRVTIVTTNRGEAATRWIDKLKGKKVLAAVE